MSAQEATDGVIIFYLALAVSEMLSAFSVHGVRLLVDIMEQEFKQIYFAKYNRNPVKKNYIFY